MGTTLSGHRGQNVPSRVDLAQFRGTDRAPTQPLPSVAKSAADWDLRMK